MAITDSIKQILKINIKPRHDSYSDQFTRIFMVKIMMIGTLLVGLNWYSDKMKCIIPGGAGVDGGFVASACWINGIYIYRDIANHDDVGYYGIPRDINIDGTLANGDFCPTTDTSHKPTPGCIPLEKTFFLQYQFMTFLLAAFAALYYSPYAIFCLVNQDMVSLKGSVEADQDGSGAETIVNSYFNSAVNTRNKMRLRLLGNVVVKILYIVVTAVGFIVTDSLLLGGFKNYGNAWISWSYLSNSMAYDYMGRREYPKPGNELLPSYGLCEVHEASQDIKHVTSNKHKFVCEVSQHILYQYAFIIIWFCMVASILIACLGLAMHLIDHAITALCFMRGPVEGRRMYRKLTLRECQYLEYVRRKNLPLYGNILQKLKKGSNEEKKRPFMEDSYEI